MTTTNRAFIKAYRHDSPQPVPAAPASVSAPVGSPLSAKVLVQPTTTITGERSALYGPRPMAPETPTKPSAKPARLASEKKPLSSYVGTRTVAPQEEPPTAAHDFLRPGTTIASFAWPSVCRTLAQLAGNQLEKIAQQLVHEAEAARSLVSVVGLSSGCGTSTVAACLAAKLAKGGQRTILVDGNLFRPRLASMLEASPNIGWQDVLKHGGQLADAVVRSNDDRFDLLAIEGRKPTNPLALIGNLQAVVTAGVLRHAYDIVLIDAGAVFDPETEPIVIELVRNMGVDAALAVTASPEFDRSALENLSHNFERNGCELLGVIENRSSKAARAL